MLTLFETIYIFFQEHIFNCRQGETNLDLPSLFFKCGYIHNAEYEATYVDMETWLCTTATIITITIVFVLCCMFVYKIVKLIGGLIR